MTRALLLLMIAFTSRGAFLSLALPYGDPLDEPFHYAYASFLAAEGRAPRIGEPSIPAEQIRPSGPMPSAIGAVTFPAFVRMTRAERNARRERAFESVGNERTSWWAPNYEAQQPPLAYALASPVLRVLGRARLDRRLLALRLFGTLIACAAVPLVYVFLRRFLAPSSALAGTAAYVAFPGVGMFVGRYTNDQLAVVLAAALLILLVDVSRGEMNGPRAAILATVLAAGLWTKLYFLALVPAFPIAALLAPSARRAAVLRRVTVAAAAAVLAFLPWLARQRAATGDWFGLTETVRAHALGLTPGNILREVPALFSARALLLYGCGFVWPGTWSCGAPWGYLAVLGGALLAAALFARRQSSVDSRRAVAAVAVAVALFLAAQTVHAAAFAAVARQAHTAPAAGYEGWYLLILFPAFLVLGGAIGRVPRAAYLAVALTGLAADLVLDVLRLPSCYAGVAPIDVLRTGPFRPFEILSAVSLADVRGRWLALVAAAWVATLTVGSLFLLRGPSEAPE